MRINEIMKRLAEIQNELTRDGADVDALTKETNALIEEKSKIESDIQKRQELRGKIGAGLVSGKVIDTAAGTDEAEERAAAFKNAHGGKISLAETRALLVSSGKIATPTEIDTEIHDVAGAHVSSIVDLVNVEDCEGMGTYRIPYITSDDEADVQTEGSAAGAKTPGVDYVDITPTSVAVLSQISKQVKKQSPAKYEAKVKAQALIALRKKAVSIIVDALKASTVNTTINAAVDTGKKGKIDDKTLRNIVLNYGGDEGVSGSAWLFLNKSDLIAFGDVRGTNEKKAVYEITPDQNNPNIGTIKDGGTVVNYCIVSKLTALNGTAQAASSGADTLTMFYGNPKCLTLGLFSDYEINVSDDFAIDKLLSTIVGDVEVGAGVNTKNGFLAVKLPKQSA